LTLGQSRQQLVAAALLVVGCIPLPAPNAGQAASATSPQPEASTGPPRVYRGSLSHFCTACVRNNMTYLAGPALRGRGSGTEDEHHAAQFIASKLKEYGLAPAAENGQYIETVTLRSGKVTTAPVLSFDANPSSIAWMHGKEMVLVTLRRPEVSGPLQKLDLNDDNASAALVKEGAVVLLKLKAEPTAESVIAPYMRSKAVMVILTETPGHQEMFEQFSKQMPGISRQIDDGPPGPDRVIAKPEAAAQLWASPEGTIVKLHAEVTSWDTSHTWNVLAKIKGTTEQDHIILLSAHLDHLGVRNSKIYPGADDDASGTVAVMELARALAKEPKPRRTIVFALWGSEEVGMIGARYWLKHPTFDLQNIVANLEFEMIARPDPKVQRDQLWLTGWDRTDLGPELVAHGAKLVDDPHPEQNFFMRSDSYALAKQGIVAQTVSSYGLHRDYHRPTDTVARVDWQHLDTVIASMIAPLMWLANSAFVPTWNEGRKP
jgi:Peptidase family M28